MVNGVLVKSLPFRDAERLYEVRMLYCSTRPARCTRAEAINVP
ncbi:MAG TPA: hypothetical protein VIL18_02145 [Longimicrobiales bacterium]